MSIRGLLLISFLCIAQLNAINIKIITQAGAQQTLNIPEDITVEKLIDKLRQTEQISMEQQDLIFEGQRLVDPKKKLKKDLGMKDGSLIKLQKKI